MSYIGKIPVTGNFVKLDAISVVNGQAGYTMQSSSVNFSPESANHMLVSLNGVIQAPISSFTVSGSTITFASALSTGDVIDFIMVYGNVLDIGTPSDNTVSTAKLVNTSVTADKLATDSVQTAKIVDDAVTKAKVNFISDATAGVEVKGDGGSNDGYIQLNCSQNSHGIKLKSPPHSASASYTLTFPNDDGDANEVLTTNGSGVLTWNAVSSDFVKLASTSGSNVSSIDVNGFFTADYDRYVVYLEGLYAGNSGGLDLYMRYNTGSYSTQSTSYNTVLTGLYVQDNGDSHEQHIGAWNTNKIIVGRLHNGTNQRSNSVVTIFNPLQTSYYHYATALCQGWNSASHFWGFHTAGVWSNTTAVTGLNFSAQSGNLYANKITLYGIKD